MQVSLPMLAGLTVLLGGACGGRADEPDPVAPAVPGVPGGPGAAQAPNTSPPEADPAPGPGSVNPVEPIPDPSMILTPPPVSGGPDMPAMDPEPEPEPAEPSSIFMEGCTQIGGYDRIFVHQRDARTDVCASLGLVFWGDENPAFDLTGLTLAEYWTVENMEAGPCSSAQPGDPSLTVYTRAAGRISMLVPTTLQGGLPSRMKLDVVLSLPDETVGTSLDAMIAEQRIVAEDLELQGSCQGF